jgi:two-component system cell cycle response regulator
MRVVLLASDQSLQQSVATLLETRGHEVASFSQSNVALDHLDANEEANALVVVDSGKGEGGTEICWEARLLSSFERPIYVCLISQPLTSDAFIEALDCGADDVLQLPLSPDELYARLRAAERFNQMQLKLVEMATRDGLTGLYNRPAFFNRAARLCQEAATPLAAVMIDIDHFKNINDSHGHAAGDKAIRAVAEFLKGQGDTVGRIGGEEFALVLDHGDAGDAWREAEALRRYIAMQDIDVGATHLKLSCSFGVAVGAPGEEIDDILRKADAALYAAKRAGRNMVALYETEKSPMLNRPNSLIRGVKPSDIGPRRQIAG